MSVDINKVIAWFDNNMGKLTYSMTGSRNGRDGTADCSGSITQALYEAGASKYDFLYSTETIHPYLRNNGFDLIAENTSWTAKRGDIVVMGKRSASAGGAGHVGIISTDDPNALLLSVCFWTGGTAGTAVQNVAFDEMWEADGSPYFYVYRLNTKATPAPVVPDSGSVDQVLNVGEYFKGQPAYRVDVLTNANGLDQVVSYALANGNTGTDYDITNNGLSVESVDKVDSNGNKTANQYLDVGDYFRLHSDRIPVMDVDEATNGVAFDTRYGRIWASASTLTEVK